MTCLHCSVPLIHKPGGRVRFYCSSACSQAYRRLKVRPAPVSKCPICGSLRGFGHGLKKYCSSACRQISYRQRKIAQGFHFYRGYFYPVPVEVGQGSTHEH